MLNSLLIWIEISLVMCFFIRSYEPLIIVHYPEQKATESNNLARGKREFLLREKEYLKEQPLSSDLRVFIKRLSESRKKKSIGARKKRSDSSRRSVYTIENGHIVPFVTGQNKEGVKREVDDTLEGEFTVVPLVIPITYKVPIEPDMFPKLPMPVVPPKPTKIEISTVASKSSVSSGRSSTMSLTSSVGAVNRNKKEEPKTSSGTTSPAGTSRSTAGTTAQTTTTDKVVPKEEPIERSSPESDQKEQVVLGKILAEVEGLLESKQDVDRRKEGTICHVIGSWISDVAGMRIDINGSLNGSKPIPLSINLIERDAPKEGGMMCDGQWVFKGEVPFEHSGLVVMYATHNRTKEVATFLGECRFCEGGESITGTWMIRRNSKDCKDLKAAETIVSDVWRRDKLRVLRQQHLDVVNGVASQAVLASSGIRGSCNVMNDNDNPNNDVRLD